MYDRENDPTKYDPEGTAAFMSRSQKHFHMTFTVQRHQHITKMLTLLLPRKEDSNHTCGEKVGPGINVEKAKGNSVWKNSNKAPPTLLFSL